jgi:hypothetical protein
MIASMSRGVLIAAAALLLAAPVAAYAQEPPPATPPAAAAPPSSAAPPPPAAGPSPAAAAPGGDAPGAGLVRQRAGKVSGTVTDVMRRALTGLLVKLESRSDPGTLRVTSTDQKGQYHFKDLPPGVYDVRVEADGFVPGSKERIDVRPPFQNIVDVSLARPGAGTASPLGALRQAGAASRATGAATGAAAGGAAGGEGAEPEAPVVVRGRFVDTGGRPALEVSVLLIGDGGGRLHQTFSAADGTFAIDGVAPGRYRVLVRSTGHMAIDLKEVDVRPVNGLKLSLALVDFPLNTQPHGTPPPEIPRPLPGPPLATPGEPAPPSGDPGETPAEPRPDDGGGAGA